MLKTNLMIEYFNADDFVRYCSEKEKGSSYDFIKIEGDTVPFVKLKKGFFRYAISLPFGLYSTVSESSKILSYLKILKKQKIASIILNISPLNGINKDEAKLISTQSGCELVINSCHILDTKKSLDVLFQNFNDTRKKHIKRYERAGIVKVFQTNESEYFSKYYDLYLDSISRWGNKKAGYSKEFIAGLHIVPGIKMWVAEADGVLLSAMICLYNDKGVFDWLAASIINEDSKKLYAAVAVQYEVIKNASENGLEYVNMGASVNLNGVSDFKDSWGAEQFETYSFTYQSPFFTLSKKMFKLVNKIRK